MYCGGCALTFTAAVFTPPGPPQPQSRALDPGSATPCAKHARNPAVAACDRCGAFMCGLCRTDADGRAMCMPCFERLSGEGKIESARTTFKSWRTLGLHLGVLGLLMSPFGLVIGPAALVATARGVAQSRKDGDEDSASGTVVAFILGGLVTLAGLLFAFAFAGTFRK